MYTPSEEILTKYAQILIDFALWSGDGIKKGDVVYLQFDLPALPLAYAVYARILQKGGHPIVKMNEERFSKLFYDNASDEQIEFFPSEYVKSRIDVIDHSIYLIANEDPFLLKDVDPKKLVQGATQRQQTRQWLFQKEDAGKFTWTLALYGTAGMAAEAGLSLEDFWEQIERACFLNEVDPLAKWKQVFAELEAIKSRLNALSIEKLHVTSKETDLWVKLGADRQFMGGSGRNIPSFELFTSPDWRGTEGHIYFDYPLYRYGNLIKDIRLEFKDGQVIKATASQNENLLKELVKQKNADKVGEYSLTDKRYSHISKFMANTLYDENFGGEWGNTHLALGTSYHEAYRGDEGAATPSTVGSEGVDEGSDPTAHPNTRTEDEWMALGFNESPEHTDIIATNDRLVEAHLTDGTQKVIYAKGEFTV